MQNARSLKKSSRTTARQFLIVFPIAACMLRHSIPTPSLLPVFVLETNQYVVYKHFVMAQIFTSLLAFQASKSERFRASLNRLTPIRSQFFMLRHACNSTMFYWLLANAQQSVVYTRYLAFVSVNWRSPTPDAVAVVKLPGFVFHNV